ncbi:hypothetical protein [Leptothoe spongobia]|uniref:hypothetical protein n=1 Tax=Leptothoe spongobia TaxID=2651728 RepID=UPI001C010578|nr:hypothetical protein [Leptothoe spongobia]
MANRLNIRDSNTLGDDGPIFVLDFLTEQITVRELIRSRVYQEVKDFNTQQPEFFRGLVQPTETEQINMLNTTILAHYKGLDKF